MFSSKGSRRPKSPIDISIVVRVAFLVRDNVGVKRHYRTLILFLLVGVFGRSAVPPVDLPETTFNEMDSPVNLAPPSQAAPKFGRPVGAAPVEDPPVKAALAFCHAEFMGRRPALPSPAKPDPRPPHSSQELLCAFLI